MDLRIQPLLHLMEHPLNHHHRLGPGGGLVGTEGVVGVALQDAGLDRLMDIPLHPVQNLTVVRKGEVFSRILVGRIDQAQGPVGHQGDFVPGDLLFRPEVFAVVVIGHHHAGVKGGVRPALGGQPMAVHVVEDGDILFSKRSRLFCGCVLCHPSHRLAVRGQMDGVQQELGELRPGDGLFRLEAAIGIAVYPPGGHCLLNFLLGPVALYIP